MDSGERRMDTEFKTRWNKTRVRRRLNFAVLTPGEFLSGVDSVDPLALPDKVRYRVNDGSQGKSRNDACEKCLHKRRASNQRLDNGIDRYDANQYTYPPPEL